MRRILLAGVPLLFLSLLALDARPSSAATPKSPKPDVGAGHIAWFDITTTNMARSSSGPVIA